MTAATIECRAQVRVGAAGEGGPNADAADAVHATGALVAVRTRQTSFGGNKSCSNSLNEARGKELMAI